MSRDPYETALALTGRAVAATPRRSPVREALRDGRLAARDAERRVREAMWRGDVGDGPLYRIVYANGERSLARPWQATLVMVRDTRHRCSPPWRAVAVERERPRP